MSEDQKKFFEMLKKYPYLARFWNRDTCECDIDAVRATLDGRRGDSVVLRCLCAIWFGGLSESTADLRVDFTDLYAYVDPAERQPLIDWLTDPFWP